MEKLAIKPENLPVNHQNQGTTSLCRICKWVIRNCSSFDRFIYFKQILLLLFDFEFESHLFMANCLPKYWNYKGDFYLFKLLIHFTFYQNIR